MEILDGFEELAVAKEHSEVKVPVTYIELSLNARYFIKGGEIGYCGLLINGIQGKGIKGKIAAATAKSYIGRTIFIFISRIAGGKKLITVPSLFEKEPALNGKLDLDDLVIKTYCHKDFKINAMEVYREHLNALIGKQVSNNRDTLRISLLELPKKGIEILQSYR